MQVQTNLGTINDAVASGSLWTNALATAAKVIGVLQIDHSDGDIDLVNNYVQIDLFESIFTNTISGSLTIVDTNNLLLNFNRKI